MSEHLTMTTPRGMLRSAAHANRYLLNGVVFQMSKVEFSKEEKEVIIGKIQLYFKKELDQEIGQFDVEFLLDFFSEEVGAYYYNRGLYDAQTILETRLESITEAIYEIEKPTEFMR